LLLVIPRPTDKTTDNTQSYPFTWYLTAHYKQT